MEVQRGFLNFLKFIKGFCKTAMRISILAQTSELTAYTAQSVTKLEIQISKCLSAA